jgi:hypothetical protein
VDRLAADPEELHALVLLDGQQALEQPVDPGSLVVGGRRDREVVVHRVIRAALGVIAVMAHRDDVQGQAAGALAAVHLLQDQLPAGPVTCASDEAFQNLGVRG